jgi:hypothetical protein
MRNESFFAHHLAVFFNLKAGELLRGTAAIAIAENNQQ